MEFESLLLFRHCLLLVDEMVKRGNAYSNPRESSPATEPFVLVFIFKCHSKTTGSKPRIQSAVKETTEWAMLASGTAAGLIQLPSNPSY